jgi:hypothetical protein
MPLEVLREVLSADYRGPRAVFSEVHVLKSLMVLGSMGSAGRGRLGSLLDLGQGEVRTLIRRLQENGLITVKADGCRLTAKGEREYRELAKAIPWSSAVPGSALLIGDECWAVLVKRAKGRVRFGIEQRDAAVRAGANGAFTAVFTSGAFRTPGEGKDCEKDWPKILWSEVRSAGPGEGDVVVISGAGDKATAEGGALAAALTLI